jgi:hypothetical protein
VPVNSLQVPYLDFITRVNGLLLETDGDILAEQVRLNVGKPVILEVYNLKCDRYRTVQVVPRADWGGEGMLGVHVRWDDVKGSADGVLHVTRVKAGSSAHASCFQRAVRCIPFELERHNLSCRQQASLPGTTTF